MSASASKCRWKQTLFTKLKRKNNLSGPTVGAPYWFSWLMIWPHYCWSYSQTEVGSFRGDAAAYLNHGGKIQIPKLTEIQSASFTEVFFFFLKWWCWYEYHKWQEGKLLTPTPKMVLFYFFYLKCSSCFRICVFSLSSCNNDESLTSVYLAA